MTDLKDGPGKKAQADSIEGLIDDQEWLETQIDETVARIMGRLRDGY
jgi:hypothetical protein